MRLRRVGRSVLRARIGSSRGYLDSAPTRLVFSIVLTMLFSCTPGGEGIVIGVVGPAKGPYADIGTQTRDGAILAAEEINRRGGIDGRQIRIRFKDDSDRSRLGSILRGLVSEGATAIIGPEDLSVVASRGSPTGRSGVAVLGFGAAGGLGANPALFRMVPSNAVMADALARWLVEVRKIGKIAVVGAADAWGRDGAAAVADALGTRGIQPVSKHEIVPGTADVSPLAQALKASGAEALVAWLPAADAARLLLATRQVGWNVQFSGPDSLFSGQFRSLAGSASDNTVLVMPKISEEAWFGQGLREWFIDYHKRFTLLPIPEQRTLVANLPTAAIAGYDAVKIVADAVQRSGSSDPGKVSTAIRNARAIEGVLYAYPFGAGREAYPETGVQVGRFLNLALLHDIDPGSDLDRQAAFYKVQVSAFHVPDSYVDTPAGRAVYDRILEDVLTDPEHVEFFRAYVAPRQPPGPL